MQDVKPLQKLTEIQPSHKMPQIELIKSKKLDNEDVGINLDDLEDRNSSSDGTPKKRYSEDVGKAVNMLKPSSIKPMKSTN